MKKVLIVIHDMKVGGAQKSLLAFLKCLASSQEHANYDVSVMPISPDGAFYAQIPENITVVEPPRALRWLGSPLSLRLMVEKFSLGGMIGEICWFIGRKMNLFPEKLNLQQQLWKCWHRLIPEALDQYDIAVSYMDGVPNYYVMEKVAAAKKVLWIHNEYQKLGYDPEFDEPYFDACDKIVTISEKCLQCIVQAHPQHTEKVHVLANITSGFEVQSNAKMGNCPEYADRKCLKLLSVGRLNPQKGFALAIDAAKRLKDAGISYVWLILGEGTQRPYLQQIIDQYGLSEQIRLLGIRENPYPYMAACDIFVQTSRNEGKSMVLDEAKILCKPIVVTNYTTVKDSVEHGESGWIVDMSAKAICEGIVHVYQDAQLRERLIHNLQKAPKGNEDELMRYLNIMF